MFNNVDFTHFLPGFRAVFSVLRTENYFVESCNPSETKSRPFLTKRGKANAGKQKTAKRCQKKSTARRNKRSENGVFLFENTVIFDEFVKGNGVKSVDVHARVEGTGHLPQQSPIFPIGTVVQVAVDLKFTDISDERKVTENGIPLPRIDLRRPLPGGKPFGEVDFVFPGQIVIAENEVFLPAQTGEIFLGRARRLIDKIAQNIHGVVFMHAAVPVCDESFVHLLHGRKGALAHAYDLRMPQMKIGCKVDHAFPSFFELCAETVCTSESITYRNQKSKPRGTGPRGGKTYCVMLRKRS